MLETKEERKPRKKSSSRLRLSAAEILRDYELGVQSRQASIIGRREVLNGRAKFGIFGDGKELAQIAMARAFRKGDFRSGYYRDQTFMFALGATSIQQFFAQLYAHPDVTADPNSAGRQMNAHFATRLLNEDGTWRDQTQVYNSSADLSPTGSQMPRMVGLGYASRLYRELDELQHMKQFSNNGNEIVFGTIGNASTAEGLFCESLTAIGVLGAAVVLSILDDEYGISVPNEYQITKGDLTELLDGFRRQSAIHREDVLADQEVVGGVADPVIEVRDDGLGEFDVLVLIRLRPAQGLDVGVREVLGEVRVGVQPLLG